MDIAQKEFRRTRHKWFPLLVLAAGAIWWWRRASYAQYHTVFHFLVVLLSVVGTLITAATVTDVPGLYFLGLTAAVSFGPLMRFMYGGEFAARRITQELVRCAT